MRSRMTPFKAVAFFAALLTAGPALSAGVWDMSATLIGVNPNGDYQSGDEIRIKKTSGGSSGCSVVKFRPGQGNLPAGDLGAKARDRIYTTALAAFLSGQPVSIWVWDTTNCYGVMLEFTDATPF